ncbi:MULTISPECIES: glycoside hydrolase family 10 protein [unclassified Coleofasciculus]|uniref:glycoside hydrolase family 10 protein n=1 Tax=unclassified Coleofasciculus TaxID=2692782 RepID=UPI00187E33B8|nr:MULTISPECIES: family 10 glycosylhydrolase [unclassified Coleofasciculus]MBE9124933.1 family 10 glycosylhydrolase [Coleofasciculus sp. LEGE 07081]MBE9147957.1 family 10 glycosylhydrolase [Coleofasciculus sp. LEGE 07092]
MKRFLKRLLTAWADGLVSFSRTFGHQAWLVCLFLLGAFAAIWQPTAAYSQITFNDIQGHWAKPCIEQLALQQIVRGYPDGSFKPNAPVTRAEFAAMLSQSFADASELRTGGKFADVPASHWASTSIRKAYQTGFLAGYPGGVFQPNQNIPRVQALVSLASGLKYVPTQPHQETLQAAFTDAAQIPDYSQGAIAAATENQLVVNYPNVRTFNPNQTASRAEIATFLCQATQKTALVPSQYIATAKTPTNNLTEEIRGVWLTNIDSDVLFSPEKTTSALQRLKELNFNTVYPTVWNWGYTLYPSQVAKQVIGREAQISTPLEKESYDPERGLQGRDVLKELVEVGHQNGMRVIPWFEFGFKSPSYSELAKRHPDWLTQKRDGTQTQVPNGLKAEDRKLQEIVWLNPFKPEVQQFIQELVVEIVRNYDVDGIQLDDHFGLPVEFGYDDFTVELYKKDHQGKAPPTNPNDPEWVRWRANKITDYLTRLFRAIKDTKQDVILSVSPNPLPYSYEFALADWHQWERRGLVEELIVQIYRDDFNTFTSELEQPEITAARRHIPTGIGILSGLNKKPVSLSQIKKQVEAVRQRGFAGVSFFFYETLWNNSTETPQQRQTAFGLLFPMPAEPPDVSEDWQPSNASAD